MISDLLSDAEARAATHGLQRGHDPLEVPQIPAVGLAAPCVEQLMRINVTYIPNNRNIKWNIRFIMRAGRASCRQRAKTWNVP